MLECTASVMIAIDPVIAPATTFSVIRIVFETIDRRAAPNFVEPLTASGAISGVFSTRPLRPPSPARRAGCAGHNPGGSHSMSARTARPRWLISSFSSGDSSAIVRSSPLRSAGTNTGS